MAGEANVWNPRTLLALSADTKRITEKLTATEGQSLFTLTDFTYELGTGALQVFKNGIYLVPGTDFVEGTSTTFSLVIPAEVGDIMAAVGYAGITGTVDVRDTDIFLANYQAVRDYAGTETTVYVRGSIINGDGGEGFFQRLTGAAPGTYVADGRLLLLPTGGDGSIGWRRKDAFELSFKSFGSLFDGSTDDTITNQAAIDFAIAAGVSLTINEGITVTGPITVSGNLELKGKGERVSIFLLKAASTSNLFTVAAGAIFNIEDAQLNGNKANVSSTVDGIYYTAAAVYSGSGTHRNIIVKDFTGSGIRAGVERRILKLNSCSLLNNDMYGLNDAGGDGYHIANQFGDNGLDNVRLLRDSCILIANAIYRAGRYNLYLGTECRQAQIGFNQFDAALKHSVYIDGDASVLTPHQITGNRFINNSNELTNTYADIYITSCKRVNISSNAWLTYPGNTVPDYLVETAGSTSELMWSNNIYDAEHFGTAVTNEFSKFQVFNDNDNFRDSSAVAYFDGTVETLSKFMCRPPLSGGVGYQIAVQGEAQSRLQIFNDGKLIWSDGTLSADTVLRRAGEGLLKTDQMFIAQDGVGIGNFVANANTPSGATLAHMPVFRSDGTLLGYVPVYAAPW